ncbi:MAG: YggS family pyridoxal phosphate-dependent enzyme [Chitinophagales bacterium]|nr:YggS family pyridoxal phosphate-dependent enzyme [Chitinophagales bacterium]
MDIINKITKIIEDNHAQLVVVSKTYSPERILEVYQRGLRVFGENKVQEIMEKKDLLPSDIQWHMIGHLQSNKVKLIAPFISMIHSVDSEKILSEIQKQAKKIQRRIDVLLQMYIATEETKYGLSEDEMWLILEKIHLGKFPNIQLRGLMGMASFSDNLSLVKGEFKSLKTIYDEVIERYHFENFNTLSMGMSGDFELALEEGSSMVRIGSLIFGKRIYS